MSREVSAYVCGPRVISRVDICVTVGHVQVIAWDSMNGHRWPHLETEAFNFMFVFGFFFFSRLGPNSYFKISTYLSPTMKF